MLFSDRPKKEKVKDPSQAKQECHGDAGWFLTLDRVQRGIVGCNPGQGRTLGQGTRQAMIQFKIRA